MSYARSAVTRMTLDISRPDLQRSETVTLGDTNRRWEVTLTNGGAPFRLPPNWTAALTGIKPDGTGLLNGCSVADGKIIYDFAAGKEIATCVGSYPVQFDVWDEVGELVASPKVYVNVLADVRPREGMTSKDEYGLLGDFIGQKNDLVADIESNTKQIGGLSERMTQAEDDIDLLTNTALTQGDEITALKEKITTAGTITIPVSEWDALMPTKAYVTIKGGEALTRGGLLLVMPGDTATKDECERTRVRIDIDLITDQQPPSVDQIFFIRSEERPAIPLNFKYFVLKTESQQGAVVALIGVDAYGEGGGNVSQAELEAAIKAVVPDWALKKEPPKDAVTSVNGQTGEVNLPIPSEAADVKADPAGTAESKTADLRDEVNGKLADYDKSTAVNKKIGDHNVSTESHADLRLELQRLADRLNAALNSDDTSLDDLKEIVAYIKSNKTLIDGVTASKVNVTDIVNNLTTNTANVPLSAAQGVALKLLIDSLEEIVEGKVTAEQVANAITAELKDYLTRNELNGAINTALAEAKESGEFDGKSAYEIWLAEGNTGTEADFLASLKGDDYILTNADKTEIANEVAELVDTEQAIPDYVIEEADAVAERVASHETPNSFTFAFVTDFHYEVDVVDADLPQILNNIIGAINRISDKTNLHFTAFGGDNIGSGNSTERAETIASAKGMDKQMRKLTMPYNLVIGNHDNGWLRGQCVTNKELYPMMYKNCERFDCMNFDYDDMGNLYGYADIKAQKIRVFFLNGTDSALDENGDYYYTDIGNDGVTTNDTRTSHLGYQEKQLRFIANSLLDLADKDGWAALFIGHFAPCALPRTANKVIQAQFNGNLMWKIIRAYKDGTSLTIQPSEAGHMYNEAGDPEKSDDDGWTDSAQNTKFALDNPITADFSSKGKGEVIAFVQGHHHCNWEWVKDGILVTCSQTAFPYNSYPSKLDANGNEIVLTDSYSWRDYPGFVYNKTLNSAKETAFDIITIDRATKKIYFTQYGAGYDRVVSYGGEQVVTYSITRNLSGCTASGATSINSGSTATVTITANRGYVLPDSITVSGATHTWNKANGQIVLSNPTGNVTITVTAVADIPDTPTYTNLAVPNDTNKTDKTIWINNARLGSDGSVRSNSNTNSQVTNPIPITRGEKIYFAGTDMSSDGNSVSTGGQQIAFYLSEISAGDEKSVYGGKPADLAGSYQITFTYHDDGTIATMVNTQMDNSHPLYMRLVLSSALDKTKIIIAKEPIE